MSPGCSTAPVAANAPARAGSRTKPCTSCPWARSARTTAEPTKPVAPVTSTRTRIPK